MYPVSNDFKIAMLSPAQEHTITGTIGSVSFDEKNIIEGSFQITNQSTGSNDVVLGSCYVGQLTAEFVGINIAYGKWINKTITLSFGLKVGEYYEYVPMGVYKVKEAKHTDHGVQVTAYDNMIKFDRKFVKSHFMNLSGMTNIIDQLCTDAGVVCGMSHAQIEALPNGDRTGINIYGSKGKKAEFANDITTLRDLLFWVAQTLGCFATMNRAGQLEFRPYTQTVVDRITEQHRIAGATFADYITHYIGIYVENLDDNTEDYYGYDATALQQELTETTAEITADQGEITDLEADRAEWVQKLANHECTQQEYDEAIAEIDEQEKLLTKDINQLSKRVEWLSNAISMSADDGSDMVLGANPLVMAKNKTTRDQQRREILGALDGITYTPFNASVVCGCIYDLGDVIQFSGGLYNSDTDSFGCVMSYTYTHNGGTELEGFGVDPSVVVVRNKTQKSVDRASKNSVDATRTYVGSSEPTSGKDGDLYINSGGHISAEPVQSQYITTSATASNPISVDNFGGDYQSGYNFVITGYPNNRGEGENVYIELQGLDVGEQYKVEFDAQFTRADGGWPWTHEHDRVVCNDMSISLASNFNAAHYSGTFTYVANGVMAIYFPRVEDNKWFSCSFSNFKFMPASSLANSVSYYSEKDNQWHNIDYVRSVTQTQTSGTEIAEVQNSDGTKTKIYQKDGGLVDDVKVDNVSVVTNKIANINTMTGATAQADGAKGLVPTPTAADSGKYLKGDGTWAEVQGGGGSAEMLAPTPFIYSEDEQQVGIWTDGKPLYQKTYYFTSPSSLNTNSTIVNISSLQIDSLVTEIGNVLNVPINWGLQQSYRVCAWWNVEKTELLMNVSTSDLVSKSGVITIQYTKTTDTPWQGGFKAYGFTPVIYSEEEREVGVWKDGKPLYERTLVRDQYYTGLNVITFNEITSDMEVKYGEGFHRIYDGSTVYTYAVNSNPNYVEYPTDGNTSKYKFNLASSSIRHKIDLTIYYTKTTDVAGSGKYTTLGVPAVHYSTSEQVVGTWIDGKTLYQKTWFNDIPSWNSAKSGCIIATGFTDFDEIIDIKGRYKATSVRAYGTANGLDYTGWRGDVHVNANGDILIFSTSANDIRSVVGGTAIITIQYTKTTD